MTLQSYTVVDVALGTPDPPGLDRSVRMYVADEVDARLALMQKQMTEMREMHAVSIADAEDRLALAQRAVEWLAANAEMSDDRSRILSWNVAQQWREWRRVPADLAAIIKPESSNGTV